MQRFLRGTLRKVLIGVLAFTLAQSSMSVEWGPVHRQYAVASSTPSCPSGNMNFAPGGTLNGPTNTYYQPSSGTLAAGSTSVTLGTIDTGGGGASTAVAAGDELLIIQMQDGGNGSFNSSNSSSYGDGTGTGSGYTSIGNAGLYEYVYVSSVASGAATIEGGGTSGGLINSYYENTSNNQRYQIVRVPEYTTATLSSNFTAAYWDGKTGGVAALDISSTLNLGGASIYATGDGFRGGGVSVASTSPTSVLNNDYADSTTMNGTGAPAFGGKGEGILGTPNYVFYYANFSTPSSPSSPTVTHGSADGYTGGDQGMGAPGNAGGGGTDDDPYSNDQNTGGGGGANGGAGGHGGYPWTPKYSSNTSLYSQQGVHQAPGTGYSAFNTADIGGRGGAALSASLGRAFMGGGGGAGANNNGSNNNSFSADGSSGGTGGGIVLLRIANTSGSAATIYANGTTGLAPNNDGGGGGGAGGTVVITSPNAFTGITVYANGAAGTTADAAGSYPANQHGPGGGGGGGIVLSSSSVSASVNGGVNGTTTPSLMPYGATSGSAGYSSSVVDPTTVPGIGSGADCYSSGTSGNATLYNGPYDSGDATYDGAAYTGSYDGVQSATNNNDFTAREIPLSTPSPVPQNTGNSATSPIGNTFTLSAAPSLNVENAFYYVNTGGGYHTISLGGTAPILPSQWTMQICPDGAQTGGTSGTPNCGYAGTGTCKFTADRNKWESIGSSGSTATTTFCYHGTTAQKIPYWAVYTGPTGTYTAFARYDAWIDATDNQTTPAQNRTHDELYAGFVPIFKSNTVVANGCPSGVSPASGVCPSGVIKYSVQYANIVSGGGIGTEGQITAAFPETQAGSLVVSDDGLGGLNGTNWGTYTNGLVNAISAGTSGSSCGVYSGGVWGTCGDTTAGTTCTYDASHPSGVGATSFACTIGGSGFQLYPSGFTGQTSSGTLTFAAQAK